MVICVLACAIICGTYLINDVYHVKAMLRKAFGGTIVRITNMRNMVHTGITSYDVIMWIMSNQCD